MSSSLQNFLYLIGAMSFLWSSRNETRSEDSTAACRPTGIEMSPNVMCPLQIARIVNAPEASYSNALANARASVLNCPESHSQTNACEQIGSVILSEAKDLLSRSKRFPEQIPRRSARAVAIAALARRRPRDDRKGSSDDRKGVVPEGLVHAICS